MLNVPENLSGAVNRQTVLTINTKKCHGTIILTQHRQHQ